MGILSEVLAVFILMTGVLFINLYLDYWVKPAMILKQIVFHQYITIIIAHLVKYVSYIFLMIYVVQKSFTSPKSAKGEVSVITQPVCTVPTRNGSEIKARLHPNISDV